MEKRKEILEQIDDFVRGAANGLTFGAADYFAALLNSLVVNGRLRSNIRSELQRSIDGGWQGTAGNAVGAGFGAAKLASLWTGGVRASSRLYKEMGNTLEGSQSVEKKAYAHMIRQGLRDDALAAAAGSSTFAVGSTAASVAGPSIGLALSNDGTRAPISKPGP